MKVPRLKADEESGYGTVIMPPAWDAQSAVLRADVLKDWITELQTHYNRAHAALMVQLGAPTAKVIELRPNGDNSP